MDDDEDESTEQESDDTSSGEESTDPKDDSSASKEEGDSTVKVPEEFQKRATELVQSCATLPCLDFLQSEVSDMRHKLMSSQKKSGMNTDSFSSADMPEL